MQEQLPDINQKTSLDDLITLFVFHVRLSSRLQ